MACFLLGGLVVAVAVVAGCTVGTVGYCTLYSEYSVLCTPGRCGSG